MLRMLDEWRTESAGKPRTHGRVVLGPLREGGTPPLSPVDFKRPDRLTLWRAWTSPESELELGPGPILASHGFWRALQRLSAFDLSCVVRIEHPHLGDNAVALPLTQRWPVRLSRSHSCTVVRQLRTGWFNQWVFLALLACASGARLERSALQRLCYTGIHKQAGVSWRSSCMGHFQFVNFVCHAIVTQKTDFKPSQLGATMLSIQPVLATRGRARHGDRGAVYAN